MKNQANGEFLPSKQETRLAPAIQDVQADGAIATHRAEVEAAYVVAMRRPRIIEDVRSAILQDCKRRGFAQAARYSKPVGNTKITGLTIRAAENFLRRMTNVRTSVVTTYENEQIRRVMVTATDLEANAGFTNELTIEKTVERRLYDEKQRAAREIVGERINTNGQTVYIVKATEDELFTKQNAMVAKVLRNEALRLIPGDVLEEAWDEIASTLNANGERLAALEEKNKILGAFYDLGIKAGPVSDFIGCPLEQITVADVNTLRDAYRGMMEEGARWADLLEAAHAEREKGKNGKAKAPAAPRTEAGRQAADPDGTFASKPETRNMADSFGIKYTPKTTERTLARKVKQALDAADNAEPQQNEFIQ